MIPKPSKNYREQLEIIKSRGLIVPDESNALFYLKYIGYYRLSGYFKNFQHLENDTFFSGITFKKVLDLYFFDRKLRGLFLDAIERIEVSLRSVLSDSVCCSTQNIYWFQEKEFFDFHEYEKDGQIISFENQFSALQNRINNAIDRSKETFIKEHKKNKSIFPESWKVFNILSFGEVSFIFTHLKKELKKEVAKNYGIKTPLLQSWITGLAYVRNISAHHSRLWNKKFDKPFQIPKELKKNGLKNNTSVFIAIYAVVKMLKIISPHSAWKTEVEKLLLQYSWISKEKMGFPKDWKALVTHIYTPSGK